MLLLSLLLAHLAIASAASQPNFVIFMPDDLHHIYPEAPEGVSPQGAGTPTPNMDRLRHEGIVFDRAYTASPKCAPSRFATLTGRHCSEGHTPRARTNRQADPLSPPTRVNVQGSNTLVAGTDLQNNLASTLQADGYHTCYAGKYHISSLGWSNTYAEVQTAVQDAGFTEAAAVYIGNFDNDPDFSHNMEWTTAEIIKCMGNAVSKAAPFFVHYQPTVPRGDGIQDAMFNYDVTQTPAGRVDAPQVNMASRQDMWARAEALVAAGEVAANDVDAAAGIIWMDEAFGALLEYLDTTADPSGSGLLADNTMIVFLMDHGMGAKNYLYEKGARIIMHMRYPQLPLAGLHVQTVVSNLDIAPTMLELAGVTAGYPLSGHSLLPVMQGAEEGRYVFSEMYEHRTITTSQFKLFSNQGCWDGFCQAPGKPVSNAYPSFFDTTQLYHMANDGEEQHNLVLPENWLPEYQAVLDVLEALIECHDLETHPASPVIDACSAVDTSLIDNAIPTPPPSPTAAPIPVASWQFHPQSTTSRGGSLEIGDLDATGLPTDTSTMDPNETASEFLARCQEICELVGNCAGFVFSDIRSSVTCVFKQSLNIKVSARGKSVYELVWT